MSLVSGNDLENSFNQENQSKIEFNKIKSPLKLSITDFKLHSVIGQGSYGKVILVTKIDTNEKFAIKVIHKSLIDKSEGLRNILTERKILEIINHPFIINLHYAFQSKTKCYYVLDYCPGGELFYYLKKSGIFCEDLAKYYAAQILLGIEALHKLNIIYRDLKPENVLLDAEGYIKLADFGLSQIMDFSDQKNSDNPVGTLEYLPPEIIKREKCEKASDWWAFGCIIYEMLTGKSPFYSQNEDILISRILINNPKFPKVVSNIAQDLILKLLCKNPLHRLGCKPDQPQLDIKKHPWFASINFDLLLKKKINPPSFPLLDAQQEIFPQLQKKKENENENIDQKSLTDSSIKSKELNNDQENILEGFSFEKIIKN